MSRSGSKADAESSAQLFEYAVERSPTPLVQTEGERHIVRYANSAFCRLCERDKAQVIGQPLDASIPACSADGCSRLLQKALRRGSVYRSASLPHVDSAGLHVYWSYLAWPKVEKDSSVSGLMIQFIDTTRDAEESAKLRDVNSELVKSALERAERAEAAEHALQERQVQVEALNKRLHRAMVETHHRVKNNLQIVAALIDMRLMDNEATVPAEEIKRLAVCARTLAAVHDILTQEAKEDQEAQMISSSALLESLLPMLRQMAVPKVIREKIADFRLPSRRGTALALVLSELVNNAVKFGKDKIDVKFSLQDAVAVLDVEDNGPGFPAGFESGSAARTGLELVDNITRWDLAGEAAYENRREGGARVRIQFPIADSPAAPRT